MPSSADVVIVGEVHDDPLHHENQARVVGEVAPTAVAFEMLTPGRAAGWDPALLGDAGALDAALGWSGAGWPDIALHLPVFEALPSGAAVLGAAPPDGAVRRAIEEGAAAVFADLGDPAAFGLDKPLPGDEQAAREVRQAEAHCDMLPAELLPGFVEAQRLRDAAFAQAILDALEVHGPPVMLVTGNGHARTDWGVPAALRRADPSLEVHAILQMRSPPPHPPADAVAVTPAPPPGADPCEALTASD